MQESHNTIWVAYGVTQDAPLEMFGLRIHIGYTSPEIISGMAKSIRNQAKKSEIPLLRIELVPKYNVYTHRGQDRWLNEPAEIIWEREDASTFA